MADGPGQSLMQGTELRQEQILSPRQIQSLNILAAPVMELRAMIDQELAQNPVLEVSEPEYELPDTPDSPPAPGSEKDDLEDELGRLLEYTASGAEPAEAALPYDASDADAAEERRSHMFESLESKESLQEHLLSQLRFASPDEKTTRIGEAVVGGIDESGYLRTHPADIAMAENCSLDDVERVLKLVQSFDPPGIGARDLKECLLLQIPPENPDREDLRTLIENHLEDAAKNRLPRIASAMDLPVPAVEKLLRKLRSLNPFPGGAVAEQGAPFVTPEVEVVPDGDEFKVVCSDSELPKLHLSQAYLEMLENPETPPDVRAYIRSKAAGGNSLMKAIEQRQSTIGRIANVIVSEQYDFLREGVDALRPMTMQQVADKLGLHETTVSRAVANKYIATPQGVFEFKYFFTGGYRAEDGARVSSRSVRELLRSLVDDEDPRTPLSDSRLTELLVKKGIDIRRRTVAKYREELGIPASHLRKVFP